MANYVTLNLNGAAIEALLNDIDGPVGELLEELSEQVTAVAKAGAPVQSPRTFSWGKVHSTSYLPWSGGYTKAGAHKKVGYDSKGHLYGGTNAPYGPTIFLEKAGLRANGMPRTLYPFLSTALYSLEL
jgi:hypothetical protein